MKHCITHIRFNAEKLQLTRKGDEMEKIQVVLASPSDLADERQMIKDLVNSLNPLYMKNGICIDLRMWENSTPGMNADGPQGLIDMDLEITNADLFVCIGKK